MRLFSHFHELQCHNRAMKVRGFVSFARLNIFSNFFPYFEDTLASVLIHLIIKLICNAKAMM